jgi:hypothetical protein
VQDFLFDEFLARFRGTALASVKYRYAEVSPCRIDQTADVTITPSSSKKPYTDVRKQRMVG